MGAARVTFSISDLTFSIASLLKGVSFVGGETLRGPVNDPSTLITSWTQFTKLYGAYISTSDFPLLCKRALDYGGSLRVSRILNYTDPSNKTTLTAVKATIAAFADGGAHTLFTLTVKYPGVDYNNLIAAVQPASNGNSAYFNLAITHSLDPSVNELYENLTIPGLPNVANSHYLDAVISGYQLVVVTYSDLSSLNGQINPALASHNASGGSDGSAIVTTDYIGDPAGGTGLNSFDGFDDALQMGFPEMSDDTLHIAGSGYAEMRGDIMYFAHLDNALDNVTALLSEKDGLEIDSRLTAFYAGGLKVVHPVSGLTISISELGDIFGIAAYSDNLTHEWYSFAGINRGKFLNAIGVVNNFGTPALAADLDQLANHQINMAVAASGRLYLSGNFSAQLATSQLSFVNANRLLIYIQKSLTPSLKMFLEEPADIPTFKAIFRGVEPFFQGLVRDRALFDWSWQGDQNINDIANVQVNNPTDLGVGKYKANLYLKIVPSLQQIGISIIVTPTSVSFTPITQGPSAASIL